MLTQAEALAQVRDALREASARQWPDATLLRWINDAVRDMARVAEFSETTDTLATTATVQQYDLSSLALAVGRIHRVEYTESGDGGRITPLEYEDYSNLDSVWGTSKGITLARPWCWTTWGVAPAVAFLLYPTPVSNGTVTFYYYSIPDKLADDGSDSATALAIPDGWDDMVVNYTEFRSLRRDRDQRWQEAKQLYDDGMQHLMNLTSRHSDQEGRIVPSGMGGVPAWLAGNGDW